MNPQGAAALSVRLPTSVRPCPSVAGPKTSHTVGRPTVAVVFSVKNIEWLKKDETWQIVVFWDERWKLNYWGLDKIRGTSSPWSMVILPNPRFQKKSFAPLYRSFLSQYFIFSMIFSSQTPFWTPKPPSLTFVYFWPSSHFPGTVKHRWTLENCCRKTVVPNFGGMVDHYEHDSAAYAVPWRASFGGLLVNLYGLIAGSLDFFLLDCHGKPFWIIKAPRPVAISFFSNFEC